MYLKFKMTVSCPSNGMKRNILLRRSWRLVSAPRPQILPLRTPDAWGQSWKPKRFSKARATSWSSTSLLVTSRSWTSTWTPWGQERQNSWRSLIKKKWLTGVWTNEHESNSFNDLWNSISRGFDPSMKTGFSWQSNRYPLTYMWISSLFSFAME